MQYVAIILVCATVICTTNALCNTCTTNGLACASGTSFRVCANGEPQGPVVKCPDNTVCTSGQQICAPAGTPSSCQKCNICNSDSVFACRSYTSFSFCTANKPGVDIYECPSGLVCSVDSEYICVDPLATGLGATCEYVELTTPTVTPTNTPAPSTTPNPVSSPSEFCEYKGIPGRFGIPADSNCKQFISCILSGNGNWIGNTYVCPNNTYFNGTSQACGKSRPPGCI